MIVNKPQFDTENIKPGQAYWLTEMRGNGYYGINTPCIITAVKPLTIVLEYYNSKQKEMDSLTLDINSIVNKTYTLEPMKVVKE
jgi:hypothetical protein